MDLHLHFHQPPADHRLEALVRETLGKFERMAQTFEELLAQLEGKVDRLDTIEDSATALIKGIPDLIKAAVQEAVAAGATPHVLEVFGRLGAKIDAAADGLAAAVANVPTPTPTPEPAPAPEPLPAPEPEPTPEADPGSAASTTTEEPPAAPTDPNPADPAPVDIDPATGLPRQSSPS